jgi:hypothetical protein
MKATSTAGASSGPVAKGAPAGSGVARLHPFDGLFLRAEHLDRIQAYTRELVRALGQAGGPGVVHGYALSVSGDTLQVGSGLAIAPDGRPLSMTVPFSKDLSDLTAADGRWWVVELVPADEPFGSESVYGALCDDPCAGTDAVRPYVAEVVRVRLRERPLDLGDAALPERRSRVASAWFEDERRRAGSLLPTSDREPATTADFSPASWEAPTGPPDDEPVAVGILLRLAGGWVTDTWTARRDRIQTPPDTTWRGRLGMRPWAVFIAQVLQFQVQLANSWPMPQASAALMQLANIPNAVSQLQEAVKGLDQRQLTLPKEHLVTALSMLGGGVAARSTRGRLVDSGFVELPPAGFLPLSDLEQLETEVADMLGPFVEPRFCVCRPDAIGHEVEQAQHLDRIPLTGPKVRTRVDVLVPGGRRGPVEGSGLTTSHNWVAFHRRRELDCGAEPEQVETVDVILHEGLTQKTETFIEKIVDGELQSDHRIEAKYPAGRWALPAADVQETVATWTDGAQSVTVVGVAATRERRPLADARAALLISAFDQDSPVLHHRTVVRGTSGGDEIWLLVVPGESPPG